MSRGVVFHDADTAVLLGLALTLAGAYVLWDAYEARGRSRPFWQRFVGVVT